MQQQNENPVINESLTYWEKEKLKALQRGAAKSSSVQMHLNMCLLSYLPQWEKKKRKRLGQVQILLDSLDMAIIDR